MWEIIERRFDVRLLRDLREGVVDIGAVTSGVKRLTLILQLNRRAASEILGQRPQVLIRGEDVILGDDNILFQNLHYRPLLSAMICKASDRRPDQIYLVEEFSAEGLLLGIKVNAFSLRKDKAR